MIDRIQETQDTINKIKSDTVLLENINNISKLFAGLLMSGHKIFVAGNGGSSTDAQHFSAEFKGTLLKNSMRKALPIISLNDDTAFITAWSNDFNYDDIFSRQLEALAISGDVFLGITTSGNSKNIISALNFSKSNNLHTVLLTGKTGGLSNGLSDISIKIDSDKTAVIQEVHILIIHLISEQIEEIIKNKIENSILLQ